LFKGEKLAVFARKNAQIQPQNEQKWLVLRKTNRTF